MVIDSPRHQSLPSIKALFGIGQHDELSSIATLPATERSALLEPPRTPLAHFSLSDLQGSLPHEAATPHKSSSHWASTPDSHAAKPQTPSSVRTASSTSVRTPSSALPSPQYLRHADHARTRSFSDASSAYDYSESERQDCHAYPPSLAALATQSHHPSMAIGARAPPSSSATREAAAHQQHQRRVSSSSSVSVRSRSRSPLVPSSSKAPGEAGFGGEHVLMRVHAPAVHGEGYEFTKEFLAAKYECQYCGKRFNRPSSLKIHVNTHTGEKPYKCSFPSCGRKFSVMSNMRRHSRVHAHQSSTSAPQPQDTAWRGVSVSGSEDDEELDLRSESSVGGSPRMRGVGGNGTVRRSSPLARMHPYAVREVSPAGGGGAGEAQSALFRLPLVPHYG
ncbi:C2H2 zinc finger [Ceratobasidium sp. AG-Ba]|nr:C2H2 zinc finger [Ceratobasidium sp. AG-Ba]